MKFLMIPMTYFRFASFIFAINSIPVPLDDGSKSLDKISLVSNAIDAGKQKLAEYFSDNNKIEISKLKDSQDTITINLNSSNDSDSILVTKEIEAGNIKQFLIKYKAFQITCKKANMLEKISGIHPKYDAVVNAANAQISLNGGGVTGMLSEELKKYAVNKNSNGRSETERLVNVYFEERNQYLDTLGGFSKRTDKYILTSEYCRTPGYNVANKFIIHALAPNDYQAKANIITTMKNEASKKMNETYTSILKAAFDIIDNDNRVSTVCIPSVGTGIYGFPKSEAGKIAIEKCLSFMLGANTNIFKGSINITLSTYSNDVASEKAIMNSFIDGFIGIFNIIDKKKDDDRLDDDESDDTNNSQSWVSKYKIAIICGTMIFIAIVIGIASYMHFRSSKINNI